MSSCIEVVTGTTDLPWFKINFALIGDIGNPPELGRIPAQALKQTVVNSTLMTQQYGDTYSVSGWSIFVCENSNPRNGQSETLHESTSSERNFACETREEK